MKNLSIIVFFLVLSGISLQLLNAQTDILPDLSNERIVIDTDREIYIAGEKLHYKLSVFRDQSYRYSDLSKYAYLVLVNESGNNLLSFSAAFSNGIFYSSFLLPDTMSTGVYRLIAYTNWMRNFSTENYACRNLIITNRFDNKIERYTKIKAPESLMYSYKDSESNEIAVSQLLQEYNSGDSIILSLGLTDSVFSSAEVCVSVAENPAAGNFNDNLNSVRPLIEPPLIREFKFTPETERQILQGCVSKNNSPVPGVRVLLTTPDNFANFQYAITDIEGIFRFQIVDYYYNRKLVLKIIDQKDNDLLIQADNKFKIRNSETSYPETYFLSDYIIKSQKIVTIQKAYFNFQQQKVLAYPQEMPSVLYIKPTSIVYPSDFVELTDMADISREILPSVRLVKKNKEYNIEIHNANDHVFFNEQPLILYNGVPVSQSDVILQLGSSEISRIEIIDVPWEFGDLEFPGVLGIFSSDYSLDKIVSGSNTIIVDYQGPSPLISYDENLPEIGQESSHFPDFRQLLYWDPDVKINYENPVQIKFKAPRNEGVFNIIIRGITGKNQPVSLCKTFLIKK